MCNWRNNFVATYTRLYIQIHLPPTHTHTHYPPQSYVSLLNSEDKTDIARKMIAEGLARLDKRKDRRLSKLVSEYPIASNFRWVKNLFVSLSVPVNHAYVFVCKISSKIYDWYMSIIIILKFR